MKNREQKPYDRGGPEWPAGAPRERKVASEAKSPQVAAAAEAAREQQYPRKKKKKENYD
jgi:hypothetical protein